MSVSVMYLPAATKHCYQGSTAGVQKLGHKKPDLHLDAKTVVE